jgi:hypothetical protein
MAQQGEAREGLEKIRDGLARHLRIGMISSSTEVMGYAADALLLAGDLEGAARELDAAFARADEIGEHYFVTILLMLRARLAQAQGDGAAAYRVLGEAVRIARQQQAAGFELKAACALVEHPASAAGDREALAKLIAGITEGHDIPDMRRARHLIENGTRP